MNIHERYEKETAALKQQQAEKLQELEREYAVQKILPIQAKWINFTSRDALGISVYYRAYTMEEVVGLLNAYVPHIVDMVKGNGSIIRVPALLEGEALAKYQAEGAPAYTFRFDTTQGDGYGPVFSLEFYTKIEEQYLRIQIALGTVSQAGARLWRPEELHSGGRSASNPTLAKVTDTYVCWVPNRRGIDAQYAYLVKDEHPFEKTIETLLTTLAGWVEPKKSWE